MIGNTAINTAVEVRRHHLSGAYPPRPQEEVGGA